MAKIVEFGATSRAEPESQPVDRVRATRPDVRVVSAVRDAIVLASVLFVELAWIGLLLYAVLRLLGS
jgi:hypothetical protein